MQVSKNVLLLIVGPTGVGKTDLSLRIAHHLQGEIISADSRQIFKFMDIGTAKPSPEQRAPILHHFIDVIPPEQHYSAGEYGRQSRKVIETIFHRGGVPIVVGGSGLYIRALVDGLFDPKVSDPEVRERLRQKAKDMGIELLHMQLREIDPETAARIHPKDSQRIIRALEVNEITGQPLSRLQKESEERLPNFDPVFVGLTMVREELYHRIDRRVDDMVEKGLIGEVKRLSEMGYDRSINAMQTVGYQEVFAFLEGKIDLDEAVRLIKRNSRRYAKRQLTWFKKDERVQWFRIEGSESIDEIGEHIIDIYRAEQNLE